MKHIAQIKIVTRIEMSKKFERLFPLRGLGFCCCYCVNSNV